jgi:UDPglucose 6-dehydrogenase
VRIGIVGYGVVGHALEALFTKHESHSVFLYDKFKSGLNQKRNKEDINGCELVFVSAPTPTAADGLSCDVSAVEECVSWIDAPICIKSTVIPGTTARLASTYRREIAFSPEYVGETHWHPWKHIDSHGFLIVGGPAEVRRLVLAAYKSCMGPETRYLQTDALTAEVCKYMENCFLATKVAFVNQFYDIATAMNVDFDELRELWLADDRIGRSHTLVTEERGFRGRCLPKDMKAMISLMRQFGGAPLLESVLAYNKEVCDVADRGAEEPAESPATLVKAQS